MKPLIAVPYFPGSNGDIDAIERVRDYGMEPLPLYFHFGDEKRLEENSRILREADGAIMCGGFPYEDRLGFGRVPAKIKPYADAMRKLVDKGKPVIAVCSGNQIAHVMRLAFPEDTDYRVRMLPNICDKGGEIVYHGFYDKVVHTKLVCSPERTAFTRSYGEGEVMPQIIAHGGGRFWAGAETLNYILENGLVVKQYCDEKGRVIGDFPINPNGSMLNIESVTNRRGNLKIGMCHDERRLNALRLDRANESLRSMREYIEDGCPDLSRYASPSGIPVELKDYSYLYPEFDPERTYDIYVKMLTDDNERTTAQLFLGEGDIDRRRLIRVELAESCNGIGTAKRVLEEIAGMDFYAGIMLKKDLPSVTGNGSVFTYEVVGKQGGTLLRGFTEHRAVIEGFPVMYEDVPSPNPDAYMLRKRLWENVFLRNAVTNVQTGTVFFFPDEASKADAMEKLFD